MSDSGYQPYKQQGSSSDVHEVIAHCMAMPIHSLAHESPYRRFLNTTPVQREIWVHLCMRTDYFLPRPNVFGQ